jgi:hypothetical protein
MTMNPGREPVQLTINSTAAQLLARLCVELGVEGGTADPSQVIVRALGLFEMAQRQKRHGGRLVFVNERGEESEVVF